MYLACSTTQTVKVTRLFVVWSIIVCHSTKRSESTCSFVKHILIHDYCMSFYVPAITYECVADTPLHRFETKYSSSSDSLCLIGLDAMAVCGKGRISDPQRAGIYSLTGHCLTHLNLPRRCDARRISRYKDTLLVVYHNTNNLLMFNKEGKLVKSSSLRIKIWDMFVVNETVWVEIRSNKVHKFSLSSSHDILDIQEVRLQGTPEVIDSIAGNDERLVVGSYECINVCVYNHLGSLLYSCGN